jgi:hypothetical protein
MGFLGLWKVSRAKAACRMVLKPFVETTLVDCDGIAQYAWATPRVMGFIGMSISLIAHHAVGRLSNDDLAVVQSECIAELVGLEQEYAGETLSGLSLSGDVDFEAGCRAAIPFFEVLTNRIVPLNGLENKVAEILDCVGRGATPFLLEERSFDLAAIWRQEVNIPLRESGF